MPVNLKILVERLSTEGQKSLSFFQNLSPDQLETTVYTEGSSWTVQQVLAHFVSSEKGFYRLVENIQTGGSGTAEDFDIDVYNERKVADLRDISTSELMDQFSEARQRTVELVSEMDQSDLEKQGRHPFLGMATLADIIKLIYRHNQIHIREVRKVIF